MGRGIYRMPSGQSNCDDLDQIPDHDALGLDSDGRACLLSGHKP